MITFAKDFAASGGYYVFCMGDEIYADRTSIVGSVGVYISRAHLKGMLEHTDMEYKHIASN